MPQIRPSQTWSDPCYEGSATSADHYVVDVATVNPVTTTAQSAGAVSPSNIDAMFAALLQEMADAAQNGLASASGPATTSLITPDPTTSVPAGTSTANTLINFGNIITSPFGATGSNGAAGPMSDTTSVPQDIYTLLTSKMASSAKTDATGFQSNSASAANNVAAKPSDLKALLAQLMPQTSINQTFSTPVDLDNSSSSVKNQPTSDLPATPSAASSSNQSAVAENQNSAAETLVALLLQQTPQPVISTPIQDNTAATSDASASATVAQPQIPTTADRQPAAQKTADTAKAEKGPDVAQQAPALPNDAAAAPAAEPQKISSAAQTAVVAINSDSANQAAPQPTTAPKNQVAAQMSAEANAQAQSVPGLKPSTITSAAANAANLEDDKPSDQNQDGSTSAQTITATAPDQTAQPKPAQQQIAIPLVAVPSPQAASSQSGENNTAAAATIAGQAAITPAGADLKAKPNQDTKPRLGMTDKAENTEKPGSTGDGAKSAKADEKNLESGLKQANDQKSALNKDQVQPAQADAFRTAVPEKPVVTQAAATAPASHNQQPDTNLQPPTFPLSPVDSSKVTAQVQVGSQHHDSDVPTTFDKLGVAIAARSTEGLHQFDIRLDPQELGRVHVRLTVDDSGQAQANLVVDKPQTLDLLQRDASNLNRALQDAGLNLSNNGLNFSLREQTQQNENSSERRGRSLSAKAVLAADAPQSRSSQGSYAPNSVRLDIRV